MQEKLLKLYKQSDFFNGIPCQLILGNSLKVLAFLRKDIEHYRIT